jgi:hypothetical protein
MRNESRQMRRSASPVMFEALEARQLMSAATVHVTAAAEHTAAAEAHAELVAEAAAAKAAAKAAAAAKVAAAKAAAEAKKEAAAAAAAEKKAAAIKTTVTQSVTPAVTAPISSFQQTQTKSTTPNLVGTWTGTIQYDTATVATPFSIDFQFQLESAASGTFHLGPAIGNQNQQSTMVISNHNNVRALILTNSLWVGFTGVLENTGNQIIGRFAYDSPTGWQTGSFNVTRNAN